MQKLKSSQFSLARHQKRKKKFIYCRDSAWWGCRSPQPKSIIQLKSSVQHMSVKFVYVA